MIGAQAAHLQRRRCITLASLKMLLVVSVGMQKTVFNYLLSEVGKMKIAATLNECVQIGPNDHRMEATTKIFDSANSFDDVFDWMAVNGLKEDISIVLLSMIKE